MVLRFLQSRQRYSYNGIDHIPVRLRKNYCSTSELRWPARLGLWENTMQYAQKGRLARPQRAKRRGGTYRTSCGPFALAMGPGERKGPYSVSDLRETPTQR